MLDTIKDIIHKEVLIEICTGDGTLVLKEPDPSSKIKKLTIKGIPKRALAFTLDYTVKSTDPRKNAFKQLSCYVCPNNGEGVNKGCDLILLFPNDDKIGALIFDLKSEKPKINATEKQLKNSRIYLEYLFSMAKCHYGIDVELCSTLSIATVDSGATRKNGTYRKDSKPFPKRPFRIEKVQINKREEGKVHFDKLRGCPR